MSTDQTTETPQPQPGGDPVNSVAKALKDASGVLDDGHRRAGTTYEKNYGLIERVAYRASFGLSYGVVYPFVALAGIVPRENALVYGLVDGASAARDESPRLGHSTSTTPASDDPSMVPQPS